jgi:hypothetical protein
LLAAWFTEQFQHHLGVSSLCEEPTRRASCVVREPCRTCPETSSPREGGDDDRELERPQAQQRRGEQAAPENASGPPGDGRKGQARCRPDHCPGGAGPDGDGDWQEA